MPDPGPDGPTRIRIEVTTEGDVPPLVAAVILKLALASREGRELTGTELVELVAREAADLAVGQSVGVES